VLGEDELCQPRAVAAASPDSARACPASPPHAAQQPGDAAAPAPRAADMDMSQEETRG